MIQAEVRETGILTSPVDAGPEIIRAVMEAKLVSSLFTLSLSIGASQAHVRYYLEPKAFLIISSWDCFHLSLQLCTLITHSVLPFSVTLLPLYLWMM